jgi:glycine cleavage system H protein
VSDERLRIECYILATDRAYHPDTHVWVQRLGADRVRLGLDPLGVETTGTIAQLALVEPGIRVRRGVSLGSVEAEKFVGPLASPLSGTVVAVNDDAIIDPRLLHAAPLDTWLVELAPSALEVELVDLVRGESIEAWFRAKVTQYRIEGVLAE